MGIVETWSQYQSVLQLAAGTNIAITGLLTVYGSEFGREARKLALVATSAESLKVNLIQRHGADADFAEKINAIIQTSKLLKNYTEKEEGNSHSFMVAGTLVCLAAAFSSLGLLVISSFKPEWQNGYSMPIAVSLTIPPFLAVAVAAFRYLLVTRKLHLQRERIESDLFNTSRNWLAEKQ